MIPVKPFTTYSWRWLSVAPTESLLNPPVFLGVLRVLARHENERTTEPRIADELGIVQAETGTDVDLVRTPERNLIRNSGQYWKGTGLLAPVKGRIELTQLGRKVAQGEVTQGEFAALMVQQTELPNPLTYMPAELEKWRAAGLVIRPLVLILEILEALGQQLGGMSSPFITSWELIKMVIPLAGTKATAKAIAREISLHRGGKLDVSNWPNCTPKDNDERLAKEFLLFLANFGFCRRVEGDTSFKDKYYLNELFDIKAVSVPIGGSIFAKNANADAIVGAVRHSPLPSIIERQRTLTTVLARPGQSRFRDRILDAYGCRCFLTGDSIAEILEAAHIIPVQHGGADEADNGICLRVDVHRLFDSGNIRIRPSGALKLSDALLASKNYSVLPKTVEIPRFVNLANVHWRDTYC